MIQTVSAKTFHHSDRGLYYHVQDGNFFPTKWMAIDYAFKQGWTYAEVFNKIRCCLYKDLSFDFFDLYEIVGVKKHFLSIENIFFWLIFQK